MLEKYKKAVCSKRNKNQIKEKKSHNSKKEKMKLSEIVLKILDSNTGDDFILPSDESGAEDE